MNGINGLIWNDLFNDLKIIYNVDWTKDILRSDVAPNIERLRTNN